MDRRTGRDLKRSGRMLGILLMVVGAILAFFLHPSWWFLVLLGLAYYLAGRFWRGR